MADIGEEINETEEDIIQRHKKERKTLQAEVQKLKHSVGKSDKKKKKEVTEKIALLEAELTAKHEKELADLKSNAGVTAGVGEVTEALGQISTNDAVDASQETKAKKPSKAQKRREKKAAQNQEREDRIREQEVDNLTSSRHVEGVKIKTLLSDRGLQIHEIPSDGNCLYAAVLHQLKQRSLEDNVDSLRQQVARYMREHQDDFIPFLYKDNGDCFSPADFEEYCVQTESTPAWGGQLEIQALSNILKIPIEVIQSEGPPLVTGQHYSTQPLILTYYRHAYGLGEHYHSVEVKKDSEEDEFT